MKPSEKIFVVECEKDFRLPPPEISSINEIKLIRFEHFDNLDLPVIFTMLAEMPSLEELYFCHCKIGNIPPQIGKMRRLKRLTLDSDVTLDLRSWEMRPVPPEFGDLESLQEITFIECFSFRQGFPPEAANLRNLKTVNFIDEYVIQTLPENIGILPNLEHLYFYGGKIQPSEVEPILAASKTLKSVTIKKWFHYFEELSEKYPHVKFYDDGVKFSAELASAENEPEKLPEMNEWLAQKRSEAEQAQYATLIMKKHFEHAGIRLRKTDVPTYFFSFESEFYANVSPILRQPQHSAMLKDFFVEIVDFYEAISGDYFASKLLGILENFIDRDPPRSLIMPLLPAKALEKFEEMNEILASRHEEDLERQNQMGYGKWG